jgi:hypothetical protein
MRKFLKVSYCVKAQALLAMIPYPFAEATPEATTDNLR